MDCAYLVLIGVLIGLGIPAWKAAPVVLQRLAKLPLLPGGGNDSPPVDPPHEGRNRGDASDDG